MDEIHTLTSVIPAPPLTGHPIFDAIAWLLGALIFLLLVREATYWKGRHEQRKNNNGSSSSGSYVSTSSVVASNERISKHLHDIAELSHDTANILKSIEQEQERHGKMIESIYLRR